MPDGKDISREALPLNDKNIKHGTLTGGTQDPPDTELQQMLARMDSMQMEIDILT